jgi:Co/Zn/Cd efflux system component
MYVCGGGQEWKIADPICTFFFSILVLFTTSAFALLLLCWVLGVGCQPRLTVHVVFVFVPARAVRLVRQSVGVLMEGVPEGLNPDEVQRELSGLSGVLEVHDLHIWSLSVGKPSLSAHLLVDHDSVGTHLRHSHLCRGLAFTHPSLISPTAGVLEAVHRLCASRFNIHHTTVQIETAADRVACNPHHRD